MQEKNEQCCSFSERLNSILKSKGIKKKDLAMKLGVEPNAISRYSRGHHLPSSSELYRISRILGVSMDWLMGATEEEMNKNVDYWRNKYLQAEQELVKLRDALKLLVNNVSK